MHGMGGIGKGVCSPICSRMIAKFARRFPATGSSGSALPAQVPRCGRADAPPCIAISAVMGLSLRTTTGKRSSRNYSLIKQCCWCSTMPGDERMSEAFTDILGPRCRALITTRDAGLLTSLGGTHHTVELLTDGEALRLLAVAVGKELHELPPEAREVLKQCGRLPLAVSLAGGMVVAGTPWASLLLRAFERHKLEYFEDEHRPEQHQNLWKMIEISVQALATDAQTRLVELGVFPEDESVPELLIATLWQHTGQLDDLETQRLLIKLKQRSLVQLTSGGEPIASGVGRVSLHDLIHDYCLRRANVDFGERTALHERLLAAYRQRCPEGWWTGPNDGYLFDHLREHLVAVGRGSELADLLHELQWLEAKNAAGSIFDLPRDFHIAIATLPAADARPKILELLDEALRRDIHFVHRHRGDCPQALFQCLWNHGWWYDCPAAAKFYVRWYKPAGEPPPKLHRLLELWHSAKRLRDPGFRWLRSLRPPPTHLSSPLGGVLRGHEGVVASVAVSHFGQRIVSSSGDRTVRVWDAENSVQLLTMQGHGDQVTAVVFSPDDRRIASGSRDKTVRLWDATSGSELAVLRGHESFVTSVAYSPDGRWVASGSADKTIRLWDAANGNERAVLRGHESSVSCIAFSPGGDTIASGSSDGTIRLWDVVTATERGILRGDMSAVECLVFSVDGRQITSGASDNTVRRLDIASRAETNVFQIRAPVASMAISPSSGRVVIGTDERLDSVFRNRFPLNSFNVTVLNADGTECDCFRGHEGCVRAVALTVDERRIVSGSDDGTIRIWDIGRESAAALIGLDDAISVAICPDGRTFACSQDVYGGFLSAWDAVTMAEVPIWKISEQIEGREEALWARFVRPYPASKVWCIRDRGLIASRSRRITTTTSMNTGRSPRKVAKRGLISVRELPRRAMIGRIWDRQSN